MQGGRPTEKDSAHPGRAARGGEASPSIVLEGAHVSPPDARFAIVASRFNEAIVDGLLRGALTTLRERGVSAERIAVVRTPGAWEIPLMCQRLAKSAKFDAVIALGAVIRGDTPHFDYVAGEAARGCANVMIETSVPVVFGVLTTNTTEQAVIRSSPNENNKGADAALAALEMVSLGKSMSDEGL